MTTATLSILDFLRENDFAVTDNDWFELGNVRIVTSEDEWAMYVFNSLSPQCYGPLEYHCHFGQGTPESIVIGAVKAAI